MIIYIYRYRYIDGLVCSLANGMVEILYLLRTLCVGESIYYRG